ALPVDADICLHPASRARYGLRPLGVQMDVSLSHFQIASTASSEIPDATGHQCFCGSVRLSMKALSRSALFVLSFSEASMSHQAVNPIFATEPIVLPGRDANRCILVRGRKPVFVLLCGGEKLLRLVRSWRCWRIVRIEWPCEFTEETVELLLAHG